ncbi:MAG TPA: amidohydrolase family protein [Jiangellaceae bacterium]
MSRTLIKGGCVLTMHPRIGNHHRADVLIEGETIAEISEHITARDAEVIDAGNAIVMPGFVDSHRRVAESLLRGDGGDDTVSVADYAADDVYAATLAGLLSAAEAGITTVVDWAEFGSHRDHVDAAVAAHAEAGLRTLVVHAASSDEQSVSRWQPELRRLAAATRGPLTGLAAGSSEPGRVDPDQLARDWGVARELGLRIHCSAGTDRSVAGTVSDLGRRRMLGRDVTLVHCAHLDDADLDAVAAAGTPVVLTPSAEMAGGQPPRVQQLIDHGIRIGLGVGSDRLAPGDLFAQIRAVISVQHATYFDLKLAGKAGLPRLLTTREVIRYGCIDGAAAAGLADVTGSLEPGKQADLIILRTDRPNIFPINDPIGAVVWGMDTSNIDWVLVAGRPLVRDGKLVADLDRVRELALTARERVLTAAGQPSTSSAGDVR